MKIVNSILGISRTFSQVQTMWNIRYIGFSEYGVPYASLESLNIVLSMYKSRWHVKRILVSFTIGVDEMDKATTPVHCPRTGVKISSFMVFKVSEYLFFASFYVDPWNLDYRRIKCFLSIFQSKFIIGINCNGILDVYNRDFHEVYLKMNAATPSPWLKISSITLGSSV